MGDAVDRAAGDVVGRRGDGDHLPRRADGRAHASCTRRPRSTAPAIWRKVWHVTLPQLRTVLFVTLMLQLIGTFQVFTEPFLLTEGGPADSTVTILLLIYRYAFGAGGGGDYGEATALSLMLAGVPRRVLGGVLPATRPGRPMSERRPASVEAADACRRAPARVGSGRDGERA